MWIVVNVIPSPWVSVAAIRSALDAVAMQLLEDHAHGCVQSAIRAGNGEQAVDELLTVVKRLSR